MIGTRTLLLSAILCVPQAAHGEPRDYPTHYPIEEPPGCVDRSDIVGYRRCERYGAWGANLLEPYVFVDVGANVRHFPAERVGAFAYRTTGMPMASRAGDEALTFTERVGVAQGRYLFLAAEFELGNFAPFTAEASASPDMMVAGLAALGVRGGFGPIALAAEVAAGGMAYSYAHEDTVLTQSLVEGRGRGELWVAPWFTIGAVVGTSFVREGEWMAGLYLGFHTHAYAGDR